MNPRARAAVLAALLAALAGGAARVGTVRWGEPELLHVDELGFVMWEAAEIEWRGLRHGVWMPRTTTYGPVIYASAIALKWLFLGGRAHAIAETERYPSSWAYVEASIGGGDDAPIDFLAWTHLCRTLCALLGTLGVAAMARAAWILRGPEAAVATAWVGAWSVGLIQHAHYFTTDGMVAGQAGFFLHACALLSRERRWRSAIYAGVVLGVMAATKLTGAMLLAAVPIALAVRGRAGGLEPGGALSRRWWVRPVGALVSARFGVVVALALLTYALLCPWGVFDRERYQAVEANRSGAAVFASQYTDHDYGFYDWRFTYNDRPHYLYELEVVLPYALGSLTLLAALVGLGTALRRGHDAERIALAAALPTFLVVGSWGVKTIRYEVPLLPGLVLAAGLFLGRAWRRGERARRAMVAVALGATTAWGLAYTLALTRVDPRIAAGRWIRDHAGAGDVVVVEPEASYTAVVGERLGVTPRTPPVRTLWRAQPGEAEVRGHVDRLLADARYLVIGDWYRRRGAHPHAHERAAPQAAFYRAVFEGRTGYELVATFESTPRLGPLVFDERGAEALSVCFDHMPVWIFERRGPYRSPF